MRGHFGPTPRSRAVSGQRRGAAPSTLLVLDGRLESYNHTHMEIYIPFLGRDLRFAESDLVFPALEMNEGSAVLQLTNIKYNYTDSDVYILNSFLMVW